MLTYCNGSRGGRGFPTCTAPSHPLHEPHQLLQPHETQTLDYESLEWLNVRMRWLTAVARTFLSSPTHRLAYGRLLARKAWQRREPSPVESGGAALEFRHAVDRVSPSTLLDVIYTSGATYDLTVTAIDPATGDKWEGPVAAPVLQQLLGRPLFSSTLHDCLVKGMGAADAREEMVVSALAGERDEQRLVRTRRAKPPPPLTFSSPPPLAPLSSHRSRRCFVYWHGTV